MELAWLLGFSSLRIPFGDRVLLVSFRCLRFFDLTILCDSLVIRKHGFYAVLSYTTLDWGLICRLFHILWISTSIEAGRFIVSAVYFRQEGGSVEDLRRHLNNIPYITLIHLDRGQGHFFLYVFLSLNSTLFFHLYFFF